MFKKLKSFVLLSLLTGCVSSGGGTGQRVYNTRTDNGSGNNSPSENGSSNESTETNKLKNLFDMSSVSMNLKDINSTRISNAVKLNNSVPENVKVGSNASDLEYAYKLLSFRGRQGKLSFYNSNYNSLVNEVGSLNTTVDSMARVKVEKQAVYDNKNTQRESFLVSLNTYTDNLKTANADLVNKNATYLNTLQNKTSIEKSISETEKSIADYQSLIDLYSSYEERAQIQLDYWSQMQSDAETEVEAFNNQLLELQGSDGNGGEKARISALILSAGSEKSLLLTTKSDLEARKVSVENDLSTLNSQLSSLNTSISAAEAYFGTDYDVEATKTQKNQLDYVNSMDQVMMQQDSCDAACKENYQHSIDVNTEKIAKLAADIKYYEHYQSDITVRGNLQSNKTGYDYTLNTINDSISDCNSSIAAIDSNVAMYNETLTSINNQISLCSSKISELTTNIINYESNGQSAQTELTNTQNMIDDTSISKNAKIAEKTNLETQLAQAESALATAETNKNNAQNIVSGLQTNIDNTKSTLTTLKNELDSLASELALLDGDYTNQVNSLKDKQNQKENLQKEILKFIKQYDDGLNVSDYATEEELTQEIIKRLEKYMIAYNFDFRKQHINAFLDKYNEWKTTGDATTKTEMIAELKKLDPTLNTTDLLTLDLYVTRYTAEKRLLDVLENVNFIQDVFVDAETLVKTGSVEKSKGSLDSVSYVYDEETKDYKIYLKETASKSGSNYSSKGISFKASDFSVDISSYIDMYDKKVSVANAAKTSRNDSNVVYTFMPDLKSYVYAVPSNSDETSARKTRALNTIKAVKNNTATDADKEFFTALTGINVSEISTAENSKKIDAAITILGNTTSDFDIKKVQSTTDKVSLGGEVVKLDYSDFGLWKIIGTSNYSGSGVLVDNDIGGEWNKGAVSRYFVSYPFYSGMDQFKTPFNTVEFDEDGREIPAGTKFVFKGNTLGMVSKVKLDDTISDAQDLYGTAKLVVDNDSKVGDLSLDFKDWYNVSFSNIDLSGNGFSLSGGDNFKISSEGKDVKGIQFGAAPTYNVDLVGQMYGVDLGIPTETVGAYKVTSSNVFGDKENTVYKEILLEGAFGTKKK